ncbi:hypothetical protein HNQ56_003261 [Anaerotaenia torta]
MAEAAEETLEQIIAEYGEDKSVLMIGRYNYDNYKSCRSGRFSELPGNRIRSEKYSTVNLTFITTHS